MMSKSELIQKVADETALAKKDVKAVIESLATHGYKELKKAGTFLLPGFAKFVVIKKPATPGAQGHQSLHQGADRVQGEAGAQDSQGSPGEGRQRRGLKAASTPETQSVTIT